MSQTVTSTIASNRIRGSIVKLAPYSSSELVFYVLSPDIGSCWIVLNQEAVRKLAPDIGLSQKDLEKLIIDGDKPAEKLFGRGGAESPFCVFELDPTLSSLGTYQKEKIYAAVSGWRDNPKIDSQESPTGWKLEEGKGFITPVPVPFVPVGHKTRIGYAILDVPITYIEQNRMSQVDNVEIIRGRGTIKKALGHTYESFTISYIAKGPTEIEGSVRDVLEQLSLYPFTTAEGGPFGALDEVGDIPYHELAVRNISLSTVDGMPGAVQVDISFDPFIWDWYCPPTDIDNSSETYPRVHMDDMICWPLFKVWARLRQASTYHGENFDGILRLSMPSIQASKEFTDAIRAPRTFQATDTTALQTLDGLVTRSDTLVTSRFAKEILPTQPGPRHFIIKVSSEEVWKKLTTSAYYVGLLLWGRVQNWNYVDDEGKFLPQSGQIYEGYLTSGISPRGTLDSLELSEANSNLQNPPTWIDYQRSFTPPPTGWRRYGVVLQVPTAKESEFLTFIRELETKQALPDQLGRETLSERVQNIFNTDIYATTLLDISPRSLSGEADVIVERISSNKGHKLATTSTIAIPLPLHEYMGALDATFLVEGKCFGVDAKRRIENIKDEFDRRAILMSSATYATGKKDASPGNLAGAPFIRVENEIFQLMGVHFVMPVTMNFSTVEGQPDVWEFTISFVSFDPETRRAEQVQFLPTSWQNLGKLFKYGGRPPGTTHPIVDRGREFFSLQASLAAEEVYQDMQLPTYGELETWIRAIHSASKPTKNTKSGDLIFQGMVESIVGEFLEDSGTRKLIESWKVPSTAIWPEAESSAYVDPDFFCYYCKDDTFLSSFDTIAKKLLGKRTSTQGAEGVEEETETAGFRFQDPGPGVTTVVPSQYTAADAGNNHRLMETAVKGHGIYSFPEHLSRAAELKQKEVKDKLDSRGDRWWQLNIPIAQETAGGTRVPVDYPGSASVFLDDNSLIPQVNHPQEVEGKLVELDIQQVDPNYRDFLRVSWRQKAARMAAGRGILRALHIKEVYPNGTDSGFLLSVGDGWRIFEDNMPREVGTVVSLCKKTGRTLDQFTSDWIDREIWVGDGQRIVQGAHTVNEFLQEARDTLFKIHPANPDWVLGLFGIDSKLDNALTTSKPGWIGRVTRVNSNYAYYINNPGQKVTVGFGNGRSARQSIEDSAEFFDAISAERRIDPNILRAFFMRRDHFGALLRPGSQDDSGFGDLYTHDPALKGLSNAAIIKEIADRYSANLETTGRVPTLALLKTHIQSTSTREKYFVDGKFRADVEADFRQAGERINRLYLSARSQNADTALAELQAFVQKYDREGAMNLYHTGYIEICRAYGSYINPQIRGEDMLFHPLNPLIVIDMYADRDVMVTKVTPNGQTSTMRFDRRDINPTPWEIEQLGSGPASSQRDEANKIKKLQASIDPQVEDAIYGMLSDLRNHSPFGRLLGAFPSYQILFINEGFYWAGGSQKLWDQFYTRTAVSSIEVFRSRHFASSTCNIVFSNMFHQLTAYNQMESLAHELAVETNNLVGENLNLGTFAATIGQLWNALLLKNPPGEIVDIWRRNQLQALALTAGIRLQVRMGYGSNASKLPVVFSGTIMSAPVDDGSVMVQAFGDGAELEKQPGGTEVTATMAGVYQDKGGFGIGKSPSNLVTEALIGPYLMGWLTHGMFRDWSQSSTSHFGEVVYEGSAVPRANVGEFSLNIYNDRTTTLEQNVSGIRNFFNINAIYNWGNENTFCIQVNEPTVWKVIQVCRRACLDFVATTENFGTRSTLFFGKWWWPYNYTYDPAILDVRGSSTEDLFQDTLLRVASGRLKNGVEIITKPAIPPDGATELPNTRLEERVKKLHDLLDPTYKSKGWIGAPLDKHLEAYALETINGDAVAKLVGRDTIDRALTGEELTPAERDNLFRAYQRWRQTYQDPKKAVMQSQLDTQRTEQPTVQQGIDWKATAWNATGIPLMSATIEKVWPILWNFHPTSGLLSWGQALDMFSVSPLAPLSPLPGLISYVSPNQVVSSASSTVALQRNLYGDTTDLLEYTRWKPLCQAYIAHSCINLVSNKIEASAERVYTDAIGIHTYNGFFSGDSVTKTNIWSVDSVPGYTPVTILRNRRIDILPIEELCPEVPPDNEKHRWFEQDYYVLGDGEWTKVMGIMAHKTNKPLYRVQLHGGVVDLTEDHVLLSKDREAISPTEALGKGGVIVKTPSHLHREQYDTDIAYLYGMFVAEGSAGKYIRKNGTALYQFKIDNKNEDLLEKCRIGLGKLGYGSKVQQYPSNSVSTLTLFTGRRRKGKTKQALVELLMSECYTRRGEKRIPSFILNGDQDTVCSFLDGFFAGDGIKRKLKGDITGDTRDTKRRWHATEVKGQTLAAGLTYLLRRVGAPDVAVLSINRGVTSKGKSRHYYRLREKSGGGNGLLWAKDQDLIERVDRLDPTDEVVYDLHTASNVFCAGIGNVLIHNSDIQPADRRTMYVDTGILLTGWTAGFTPLKRGLNHILNLLAWQPGPAQDALQTPTTPAIQNSVVQSLIDSVKEMYQGWFTITGQPTIKPHDLVIITDHKHKISGPVWVKEVIHRLDSETGLKTFISPDCVAMPHTSLFGAHMIQSLTMGVLGQLGSFMALKAIAAGTKAAFLGKLNAKTGFTNAVDLDTYYELVEKARSSPLEMSDKFASLKEELLNEPHSSPRLSKRFPREQPQFQIGERYIDTGVTELSAYRREIRNAKTWEELEDVLQRYRISGVNTPKRTTVYGKVLQHERDIARGVITFNESLSDAENVLSAQERKAAIDLWMKDRRVGFIKSNLDEVLKVVVGDNEEVLKVLKELRDLGSVKKVKDVARQKELLATLDNLLTDEDKVKIVARIRNANLQPIFLDRSTVSALEAIRETLVNPVKGARAIGSAAAKKLEGLAGALKALISRDPDKGFERVAKQPSSKIKFVQVAKNVSQDVKAVIKGKKSIKDTAIASKMIKAGARTGRAIKGVTSGARLAKYVVGAAGGPVGEALMLLIDIAQFLMFDGMIEGLNNLMKARQCVKIYPLTAGGVPYLAGVRGHQGAVLGDYPSWMDELYMSLLMPGGMNIIGWTAAVAGLESPNYARTEIDAQVMEIWEEQRKQDTIAYNDALRQEREGAGVP